MVVISVKEPERIGEMKHVNEGKGKTGTIICQQCSGKRRILGNQKLEKIKFPKGEKFLKIESMGNISSVSQGKSGYLFLMKRG